MRGGVGVGGSGWGGRVDFLGAENGIIAGMKNPCREIQNRAVAQPLVVGRMAAMLSGLGRGGEAMK